MSRVVSTGLALLALLVAAPVAADAAELHGAPLPSRAKQLAENHYASPKGFRDTVEFYRKELDRRGVVVEYRAPERWRDVVFARFLANDPAAKFAAVHIVLADGKTTIYIVPPKIEGDEEQVQSPENTLGDRLTAGRRTLDPSI